MNTDEIYKKIQNIFQSSPNPVIILGSGASAPYHIASMKDLATSLRLMFDKKEYKYRDSVECVDKFLLNLNQGMGLEEALLDVRVTEEVEHDIIINVWSLISEQDNKLLYDFITGKCKLELTRLFDRLIYGRNDSVLNVVTTNYDRIAEYAASKTEAFINTGFSHSYCGCNSNYYLLSTRWLRNWDWYAHRHCRLPVWRLSEHCRNYRQCHLPHCKCRRLRPGGRCIVRRCCRA